MLVSKLLRLKKSIFNSTGEALVDLVSSTFKFDQTGASAGPTFVGEEEVMRPDLLSNKVYGSTDHWELILKYNGISNPFSLDVGEILLVPAANVLTGMAVAPKDVPEKGTEPAKKNEQKIINPKTN
jgi:hypothetical protein